MNYLYETSTEKNHKNFPCCITNGKKRLIFSASIIPIEKKSPEITIRIKNRPKNTHKTAQNRISYPYERLALLVCVNCILFSEKSFIYYQNLFLIALFLCLIFY